jgi:riboflavin kinase / FMN adenylyltransferase
MELVRGLHNLPQRPEGCVLTVGNYDGVHLGHQKMIGVLKQRAAELRSTAVVLVFEPSSKEFIDPEGAPPRLTRWREKYLALASQGVDRLVTLRFDESMRAMTPASFVELIVEGLGARHIVVGNDFRYGCNAGGTIDSLRAAGEARGFGVEQIAPFVLDGVRVSSTAVRERLGRSDFAGARPRRTWAAVGPHVGLSHRKPAADAAPAAGQRGDGGSRFWRRAAAAVRGGELRNAAHGGWH